VINYNDNRHHDSIDKLTLADIQQGNQHEVLAKQSKIKRTTMEQRKKQRRV
jgi:hypothetical protein